MPLVGFEAILCEIERLHNVSERLAVLAERHSPVSEALMTISGSVRNSATVLGGLIATKMNQADLTCSCRQPERQHLRHSPVPGGEATIQLRMAFAPWERLSSLALMRRWVCFQFQVNKVKVKVKGSGQLCPLHPSSGAPERTAGFPLHFAFLRKTKLSSAEGRRDAGATFQNVRCRAI